MDKATQIALSTRDKEMREHLVDCSRMQHLIATGVFIVIGMGAIILIKLFTLG